MTETPNGTREHPQHVQVEGSIPPNVVIRIFLIAVGVMVLIGFGFPLALRWHDQDSRIGQVEDVATRNRLLVAENGRLQRQLKQFVSDQCIQAESRDVVNVQTNDAMILLLNKLAPKGADIPASTRADIDMFIQSLRDANLTLEPEGEKDCQPGPEGGTP